jgi:hypothetical protein
VCLLLHCPTKGPAFAFNLTIVTLSGINVFKVGKGVCLCVCVGVCMCVCVCVCVCVCGAVCAFGGGGAGGDGIVSCCVFVCVRAR